MSDDDVNSSSSSSSAFVSNSSLSNTISLCVSRGVVVEETRNSVKEEPRVSSGGRGAEASTDGRGRGLEQRRWRLEQHGGSRRRAGSANRGPRSLRNTGPQSRVGGLQRRTCGGSGENRRHMRRLKRGANSGAGGEDRAATTALTTNSRRGGVRQGCRRRALQRKDKAGESRSTSTMTVDDDGDGGGESLAVAETSLSLCREGSGRMGCWFLPFFG
ncbi:hypothetical protein Syun_007053 [Stephania yunnanensis]|uniref:Uncharacterized protein n=1 Tax=Stephania yunnanensis TaxID=152371 RepID=A0AAP0KZJ1_9MAGN